MSFIVIEGLDGSGKSTQVKRLCNYLTNNKIKFEYIHFPRTDEPNFGLLISRFLRGELGDLDKVDPWVVAMLFAGDRWAASSQIRQWISEGTLVVVDRYVFSNMAYQVAKVKNIEEKIQLRNWIYALEYETFTIPKPDISIWLDAPLSFVEKQLKSKRSGDDRDYLQGVEDIHETSIDFQQLVYEEYAICSQQFGDLVRVPCYNHSGEMMNEDTIFDLLLTSVRKTIKEI
jgi:dTMP kinase